MSDHRRFSIFFRTVTYNSQLSDLTTKLHKTTSLKSISQKRWPVVYQIWSC